MVQIIQKHPHPSPVCSRTLANRVMHGAVMLGGSAGLDGLHQAEELSIRIRQGCRIHHLVATLTRPGKQSQKTMGKLGKIHHFS